MHCWYHWRISSLMKIYNFIMRIAVCIIVLFIYLLMVISFVVHAKGSSSVLLPATHTITKSSTTPAASTVTPTAVTTKAPTNSTPTGGTTVVQSPSHRSPTHTSQTKTTPGNHSTPTPTPTSSGNHSSTGKPTTNGNHSSTPTSPTPRGKPKGKQWIKLFVKA